MTKDEISVCACSQSLIYTGVKIAAKKKGGFGFLYICVLVLSAVEGAPCSLGQWKSRVSVNSRVFFLMPEKC